MMHICQPLLLMDPMASLHSLRSKLLGNYQNKHG
jgi:hypothetical protein